MGRKVAGELAVMAGIALLLAVLGPFGTFAIPFGLRVANWLLFMVGGYAFFRPVIGAGAILADHSHLPRLVAIGIACALAAFPTTVLVAFALTGMNWQRLPVGDLAGLYPQVLLIGAVVTALKLATAQPKTIVADDAPAMEAPVMEAPAPAPIATSVAAPEAEPGPPFLSRLPVGLGRDLLALENEDHYVRAHMTAGSTLILMRLSDAVAELTGIDGARTHRSWWVARAAVDGVVRRDRAVALRLTNGLEVPVARASVAELRAAGWW